MNNYENLHNVAKAAAMHGKSSSAYTHYANEATPLVILDLLNNLKAAQESLREHMRVLRTLRDEHGVDAGLIESIFNEEQDNG